MNDPIKIISKLNRNVSAEYFLDDYGLVNVDGSIYINDLNLTKIPVRFGTVTGDFDCSNNKIISLEGSPKIVGECFDCSKNRLTSLLHSPLKVGIHYICHSNRLKDLEGISKHIAGNIDVLANPLNHIGHLIHIDHKGYIFSNGKLFTEYVEIRNLEINFI